MKRKTDLIERMQEFDRLSDMQKIEARISWLEWKMVGLVRFLISATSMIAGSVVAWLIGDFVGSKSAWLLVPVFLITCMGV
jgi:uncharacterized membrane protein YoaK (UPF0700 family)